MSVANFLVYAAQKHTHMHKETMRHMLIVWLTAKGTNLLNISGTFIPQATGQDFAEEFS